MTVSEFIQKSGLKILAIAQLDQKEYSIALYLLHCSVSGLDKIITTHGELSELLDIDSSDVEQALAQLRKKCMIKTHYSKTPNLDVEQSAFSIQLVLDTSKWKFEHAKDLGTQDAIVYPFRRKLKNSFSLVKTETEKDKAKDAWKKIFEVFEQNKELSEDEKLLNQNAAKLLIESQPYDLVTLILEHFKGRIKSLHFLASSWYHYVELYERENRQVNFGDAKKKHIICEEELRKSLTAWLAKREECKLTLDEVSLLNMLYKHKHPRRQIFWAFQEREQYKNLKDFFKENESRMLPITTMGTIIKK